MTPIQLRAILDKFHGFDTGQIAEISRFLGTSFRELPEASPRARIARERWYADFITQDMGSGWPKQRLGGLVSQRIHNLPGENDLHDASVWLANFMVPPAGYDVRRIAALRREQPGMSMPELLDAVHVKYVDVELEEQFLRAIYTCDPDLRMRRLTLATKDEKVDGLFTHPARRFVYTLLSAHLRDASLFAADTNALRELAETEFSAFYDRYASAGGDGTAMRLSSEDMWGAVQGLLDALPSPPDTVAQISVMSAQLQQLGANRKGYIDDAMMWLERHVVVPQQSLIKVWRDRHRWRLPKGCLIVSRRSSRGRQKMRSASS